MWTAALDAALRAAVAAVGQGTWSDVAAHVEGRSDQQCKDRWKFLQEQDTDLKTGPFTEDEDKQILQLLATHGRKWAEIAPPLGRGAKQVQNHSSQHRPRMASQVKTTMFSSRSSRKYTDSSPALPAGDKPS